MKQLFQDIIILIAWICCILFLSWLLIWLTAELRSASLISGCNADLKSQNSSLQIKKMAGTEGESLLFSTGSPQVSALLSSIVTPYGGLMSLLFLDTEGLVNNYYSIGTSSNSIYNRTPPKVLDFYLSLWISSPVFKEKRSK